MPHFKDRPSVCLEVSRLMPRGMRLSGNRTRVTTLSRQVLHHKATVTKSFQIDSLGVLNRFVILVKPRLSARLIELRVHRGCRRRLQSLQSKLRVRGLCRLQTETAKCAVVYKTKYQIQIPHAIWTLERHWNYAIAIFV